MQTVEFKYNIGDNVLIKGLETKAQIDALMVSHYQEFRVVFWNNGDRKSIWLEEWEIEKLKN